jgi:hypothetical protein
LSLLQSHVRALSIFATVSYTTKVMQDDGTTRNRLGTIPCA